jgi:hypothetical protein
VIGIAKAAMPIVEVGTDSLLALLVAGIVGIVDGEFLEYSELPFNQVEPTCLGRSPGGMNVQFLEQGQELRVIVDLVEVIKDDEQPAPRIALAEAPEGIHDLCQSAPRFKYAIEVIAMHIVEGEEVLDAVRATIGGTHPNRALLFRPGHPAHRADLQRSPLVEAQHHCSRRASPVKAPD